MHFLQLALQVLILADPWVGVEQHAGLDDPDGLSYQRAEYAGLYTRPGNCTHAIHALAFHMRLAGLVAG